MQVYKQLLINSLSTALDIMYYYLNTKIQIILTETIQGQSSCQINKQILPAVEINRFALDPQSC